MIIESLLRSKGFAVQFPGQIPAATVAKAFNPQILIDLDVTLSNRLVDPKPAPNSEFAKPPQLTRFNPEQRALIYVANMCLLDLMRGEVHTPFEGPILTPLPFVEKIKSGIVGKMSLVEPMVKASHQTIREFDDHYRVLTPVLQTELEAVGANGMARAILDSVTKAQTGNTFVDKGRFLRCHQGSLKVTECLGPYIGMQMIKDAVIAISELSKDPDLGSYYDRTKDREILRTAGAQESIAKEIITVFPEMGYRPLEFSRQSGENDFSAF